MADGDDKRIHRRHMAEGMGLVIGGKVRPVVDISAGGVCFRGPDMPVGQMLIAELVTAGNPLEGEMVMGRVRDCRDGLVHVEFSSSDAGAIGRRLG